MANALTMVDQQFETKKNWKATTYTGVVIGALLLFFIVWRWPLQTFATPVIEEGIEVNLGNSEQGLGEDQPFLPGKPAPSDAQAYTPPPKADPVKEEDVKDIATDDKHEDAPEIKKPPVVKPKPEATKVPEKEVVKNVPVKRSEPVSTPTPPAPKPKAQMKKGVNGTGTGGNEADNFKKGGNQGIAGGNGDQGKPGGDPDSKNYTGGGKGNSGVAVTRGLQGRNIVRTPVFEDEFNENAKVAMDIRVDASGSVISAEYQPRGSTTSDPGMKAIAKRKAMQVKFNSGSAESAGTIVFNFKLKN
jgi:outer membrane biosynthesis protein TonB